MKTALCFLMFLCLLPISANAIESNYLSDPIYAPLYEGAEHPLTEMITMAKNGDIRAQYILGDLYQKGKGGFTQDIEKAKYWFEQGAKQKNLHSFVRLAAIAKREKKPITTYQWYILGMKYSKYKDKQLYKFIKEQRKNLIEKHKLSKEDIKLGKKQAKAWQKSLKPRKTYTQTTKPQYN